MPCSPAYAFSLYPCDLTDAEWAQLVPLLPGPVRRGRPRRWSLRLLVNALFYALGTGCGEHGDRAATAPDAGARARGR